MDRYLIVHPLDGVYLGDCLGLEFWSNLDSAGQDCAVTLGYEGALTLQRGIAGCELVKVPEEDLIDGVYCERLNVQRLTGVSWGEHPN